MTSVRKPLEVGGCIIINLHKFQVSKIIPSSPVTGYDEKNCMILFVFSVFTSSFLLFLVQPMIGKYILPWFGSSPAVWSATLLFFQVFLSMAYAYAYGLANHFSIQRQGKIHVAVLSLSIMILVCGILLWKVPLLPDATFQPEPERNPFWQVILVLSVSVGIPYFLLASNSTLLQSWFFRRFPSKSPYRLYALSNFASILGLLSYPVVIELFLPIVEQAWLWLFLYCLFALSVFMISWGLIKVKNRDRQDDQECIEPTNHSSKKISFRIMLLWFTLPAIASLLLLAITNQITQEIAVVPFLWVLPLVLYLFSFILCFEGRKWYGRTRFIFILGITVLTYWLMVGKGPLVDIEIQITVYCLLLFVGCMICHGELSNLRPKPRHLTAYYLLISLGGAAGGIFVNLVAPLIFTQYQELFYGLMACCVVFLLLVLFVQRDENRWKLAGSAIAIAGVLTLVVVITVHDYQAVKRGTLWMERNFYGILRVKERIFEPENEAAYELIHGITIHGLQFVNPEKKAESTTYYTETSGVGLAYKTLASNGPVRAGVLGLGVGTMAVYGKSGDTIRFYEINPAVIDLAEGEGNYFTYLKNSKALIEIVPGDARLSLKEELITTGSQHYNLLVLDTFSSDAIPIHLMTFEAFGLYLNHLDADGVLAVHISNIHLDLQPVVYQLGQAHHLYSNIITSGKTRPGSSASVWVLLTRNQAFFSEPLIVKNAVSMEEYPLTIRLWTDNYSNLYQILR